MPVSEEIEQNLSIKLPQNYKELVDEPPELKDEIYFDYCFYVDSKILIEENRGYTMDRDSISDLDDGTFWGGIKRYFMYGSKTKLLKARKDWFESWINTKRFIIGGDGGEETYFIHLDDVDCAVYSFDLETQKSSKKFDSLEKYIEDINENHEDNT